LDESTYDSGVFFFRDLNQTQCKRLCKDAVFFGTDLANPESSPSSKTHRSTHGSPPLGSPNPSPGDLGRDHGARCCVTLSAAASHAGMGPESIGRVIKGVTVL